MKKLIAVLLVVFACFSLSANDIPMDWYLQIVKALPHFSASDFERFTLERVGEKTVKMSCKSTEGNSGIETVSEYYFRFNLTSEEIEKDRVLLMEKVGEIFSNTNAKLYLSSYDGYTEFSVGLIEDYDETLKGKKTKGLYFTYDLENTSLTHFFLYASNFLPYHRY